VLSPQLDNCERLDPAGELTEDRALGAVPVTRAFLTLMLEVINKRLLSGELTNQPNDVFLIHAKNFNIFRSVRIQNTNNGTPVSKSKTCSSGVAVSPLSMRFLVA